MYDLIGDIHGHADELKALLRQLDYQERAGVFRHPDRTVLFCGDFIDRGPQIGEVLRVVRSMVDSGNAQAVMGNHEYNAVAFHTKRADQSGEFFRRHTVHNLRQHQATLDQLSSNELRSAIDWFRTLPVNLDLGTVRVVHACWDAEEIRRLNEALRCHEGLSTDFLRHSIGAGQPLFRSVERVLKGPELELPPGIAVRDKEGSNRRNIRIRWFESPNEHTLATYSLPQNGHPELISLPVQGVFEAVPYPADAPPVFIGHYWMPDAVPRPLAPNIACLDYSVAKDGMLCAYRFDGESVLHSDKFVAVPARRSTATSAAAAATSRQN